jgi:succinoglycan biosynthesis transport protein ExoP
MLDKASVARRALDFEDYMDVLRRNVRWIVGPIFAGLVVSTVVAYFLQDTFISRALIRIVPQQINDTLVQNVSSQDMLDRINGMAQNIVSRTTLENLITQYGLYKSELKSEPMEDVYHKMSADISIRPTVGVTMQGKGLPAMEVAFKYRDRMLANKICQELVSRFLNLSTVDIMDTQTQANQFLQGERDKAKTELDRSEQALSDYRTRHAGSLPEEMQGNFQEMTAVEQRLNSLSDAASRNGERHMMLESSLRIARDRQSAMKNFTPTSIARSEKTSDLDKRISDLETTIASMKDQFTADYPDLQTAEQNLAVLRRQRDEASKASPLKNGDGDNPAVARERLDAQSQIDAIQTQIKAATLEDQQISKEILAANAQLREFQGRLEASPTGEREYADLIRDRDTAKMKFLDFDAKVHKSGISMDLEKNKQGETLELIDAPSLPTEPTEPKRGLIVPLGAVGGLALGIILVAIREVKDTSLKNLKDARMYTQLSILGSIPLLENDVVVQRRKQVMLVSWATATVLGIAIIVGSVAHYYLNRA